MGLICVDFFVNRFFWWFRIGADRIVLLKNESSMSTVKISFSNEPIRNFRPSLNPETPHCFDIRMGRRCFCEEVLWVGSPGSRTNIGFADPKYLMCTDHVYFKLK